MQLTPEFCSRITRCGGNALSILKNLEQTNTILGEPISSGGYLTIIADEEIPCPLLIQQIGDCSEEGWKSDFTLSQERGQRLYRHPRHVSSRQSRKPKRGWNGGAIRIPGFKPVILSFAGTDEHADEMIVVSVACKMGLIDTMYAHRILKVSKSPFTPAHLEYIAMAFQAFS